MGTRANSVSAREAVSAASLSSTSGETIAYAYDAKGRLVKVERSGGVNNGVKAEYAHDKANNRKSLKVTGSPNPAP